MVGEHFSTAAENVCRLQTAATVGSPERNVQFTVELRKKWSIFTREYVFVDACQLDIGLRRIRDDETIDNTFRDSLRHCMTQDVLHLHRRCIVCIRVWVGLVSLENIE